jgi:hypothetical protein
MNKIKEKEIKLHLLQLFPVITYNELLFKILKIE